MDYLNNFNNFLDAIRDSETRQICPTCNLLRPESEFISFECLMCDSVRGDTDQEADNE